MDTLSTLRKLSIVFTLFMISPSVAGAVAELTFEEQHTYIPVVINDHELKSPWGEGKPSAAYPTLVDIDNDNDYDLFIGTGDGTLIFYRNNGSSSAPEFDLEDKEYLGIDIPQYILFPTFGDTDGDGDQDLYFGDWSGQISYYKNRGNEEEAAFFASTSSENGIDLRNFAAPTLVDINNDGDLDLFIGDFNGNINYFENTGSANKDQFILTSSEYLKIGGSKKVAAPAFADIDNDGDQDLFVGNDRGKIEFYRNTGNPINEVFELEDEEFATFEPGYTYPTFVDMDGDNDYDLFVGNSMGEVHYLRNNGSPSNPSFVEIAPEYFHIDVGNDSTFEFLDIDDDGDEDLFVLNSEGEMHYFKNMQNAARPRYELITDNYLELEEHAYSFKFADIDNDNDYDLIMGFYDREHFNEGGHLELYRNIGTMRTPNFTLIENSFVGIDVGEASAPELFDRDNDGDLDLFIGSKEGNIFYYRNVGNEVGASFELETEDYEELELGGRTQIRFADIDGDNDYDMLIGDSGNSVKYYENVEGNVGHNYLKRTLIEGLDTFTVPRAFDADYDGKMDMFVGTSNGNIHHFAQISKNIYPPEDVTGLEVSVDELTRTATITWEPSLDSEGDLSHYKLYQKINDLRFNTGTEVGTSTSATIVDISRGTKYTFKITSVDESEVESEGAAISIVMNPDEVIIDAVEDHQAPAYSGPLSEFCGGFPDVIRESLNEEQCSSVDFVKNYRIFTGTEEGRLEMERPINRAELTKVLAEAFNYEIETPESMDDLDFNDVEEGQWYVDYVYTAQENDIVEGYPDGTFRPGQTVNKVELLKLVLEMAEVDLSKVDIGTSKYADIPVTAETEWFIKYTNYAFNKSLIDTIGNVLNPNEAMSRADVILVLYRLKTAGLAF